MATPQSTQVTFASPAQWTDGTLFDGFILIGIALPTVSGVSYPSLSYQSNFPSQRLPQWYVIPVTAGVPNQNTFVFFTNAIDPPNCRYTSYFYDHNKQQVSGPSTLFQITSAPFVMTVPTLTAPTAPTSGPTPATIP